MSKTWKVVATFNSFDEADQKRNIIRDSGKETKVHRCGTAGSLFAVKVRTDEKKPRVKAQDEAPKDNPSKLGDKRKEKRAKKKLRKASKDKT